MRPPVSTMPRTSSSCLGRQADHEVQLHAAKPRENTRCADSMMSSSVTFLLTTSRMRCVPASGANVSPPARTRRHLVEQILVEAVGAQRRHRQRHAALAPAPLAAFDQRRDAGEVGRRQRRQRGLVVAALLDAIDQRVAHRLRVDARAPGDRSCPPGRTGSPRCSRARSRPPRDRTPPRRRAPACRPGTDSVEVLDHRALHRAGTRGSTRRADHVMPVSASIVGRVQRRHVERLPAPPAGSAARAAACPRARSAAASQHERRQRLLGLADEERVDEGRHRLGVRRRRAARDDQRAARRRGRRCAAGCRDRSSTLSTFV